MGHLQVGILKLRIRTLEDSLEKETRDRDALLQLLQLPAEVGLK